MPNHATHTHRKRQHVVPANAQAYINSHLADAKAVSAKYDLPVSLILGQSALETGWGRRVIGNAFFGVKGTSSSGNSVQFATHEQDQSGNASSTTASFRAFGSFLEAAEDWASLIIRKYPIALAYRKDGRKMSQHLHGYATDVRYSKKMLDVFYTGNLSIYDK